MPKIANMKCIVFNLTKLLLLAVYFVIQVSSISPSWCASPSHRFHFQCLFRNQHFPKPTARPHQPHRPTFHTHFQPSRAPRTPIQRLRMAVRPPTRSRFRNVRPTHVPGNFRPPHVAPNHRPFNRRVTTRRPSSAFRQTSTFHRPVHSSTRAPVQRPHFRQPGQASSRPHFRQPVQSSALRAPPPQNQFRQPTRAPVSQPTVAPIDSRRNAPRTNAAVIPRIRQQLRTLLTQDPNRIALWVRLGFHVCVGGCDGCLHLESDDNRGLNATYRRLQRVHSDHAADISLADLVVLAAVEAANQGMGSSSSRVEIPMRFGRRTCSNTEQPSKRQVFPKGDDPRALEGLMAEFSLSRREAIALLGAHSLGRCNSQNSGFVGPWDNTPRSLDRGYYQSLVGSEWVTAISPGGKVQWTINPDNLNARMMLTADLAIFKQFTVHGSQSQPSCSRMSSCPNAPRADQDLVRQYASNEEAFHNDFKVAYVKMCEKTSDTLFSI